MAKVTLFSFRPGRSGLHRLDTRVKLLGLALVSLLSLGAESIPLMILSLLLAVLAADCRLALNRLAGELKIFFFLLLVVFAARALSTPGEALWQWQALTVTADGLRAGGLMCWRLVIVIVAGLLLVVSTRTARLTGAVRWYLKPVPLVDETRVALMMGLVVRFIPRLFLRAGETADAQRARCVENRKNPVYRTKTLVIPLLRNVFQEAEELVQAMESRGYTGRRTEPEFAMRPGDWTVLILLLLLPIIIIL